MRRLGSGLFRRRGKCAGIHRGINDLRLQLVFRGPQEKCANNPNEISAFATELVFREVPGKLVQRGRDTQRFGVFGGVRPMALVDPVGDSVTGVAGSPTGLGFLAAGLLAVRPIAGSLTLADSRVRTEPPPADPARFLPGFGHARPWSPGWVGQFCRAGVGRFSQAPTLRLF